MADGSAAQRPRGDALKATSPARHPVAAAHHSRGTSSAPTRRFPADGRHPVHTGAVADEVGPGAGLSSNLTVRAPSPPAGEASSDLAGPTARSVLLRLLDSTLSDPALTRAKIAKAIAMSGEPDLPEGPKELCLFVRAHMLDDLVDELGAQVVRVLLEDLEGTLRDVAPPRSSGVERTAASIRANPPSTRPEPHGLKASPASPTTPKPRRHVVLVDTDRFRRSLLARALLAQGCDVGVAESAADLPENGERVDALFIEAECGVSESVLQTILETRPTAAVIWTYDDAGPKPYSRLLTAQRGVALPRSTKATVFMEQIARLLGR